MSVETSALHEVRLPRQGLRQVARSLLQLRHRSSPHPAALDAARTTAPPTGPSIRTICISDTHNLQPTLPPGDLLVHAGDLTEWGTFDELQSQLTWLSAQPHQHKVLIAGNHDLLLDTAFLSQHPDRLDPDGRTRDDLDFGSVTYLQDASVRLSFGDAKRTLHVYGSPWTPRYGAAWSAFQYAREGEDRWEVRVSVGTDVLVTHGPPAAFNGIKPSAGCADLRREVARVRPRLMVFGHIHVARGEEVVTLDAAQGLHDDIVDGLRGWLAVPLLVLAVVWSRMRGLLGFPIQSTRMIDAAVVDGMKKDKALDAFVVDL